MEECWEVMILWQGCQKELVCRWGHSHYARRRGSTRAWGTHTQSLEDTVMEKLPNSCAVHQYMIVKSICIGTWRRMFLHPSGQSVAEVCHRALARSSIPSLVGRLILVGSDLLKMPKSLCDFSWMTIISISSFSTIYARRSWNALK